MTNIVALGEATQERHPGLGNVNRPAVRGSKKNVC